MPDTTDAYTHRIGRTGRVNNTGEAFTLVTGEDKGMIKALEKVFKKPVETRKLTGFNYDVEPPDVSVPEPSRKTGSRSKTAGNGRKPVSHIRGVRPPRRRKSPGREKVSPS